MYNPKVTACLILLAAMLSLAQAQTTVVDRRNSYCDGSIPAIDMTTKQFESMRTERDNIFTDNYSNIVDYYKNNDIGELFLAFLPWAILLLILMLFCFISIIVFITLCCGKYKRETNRTGVYTAFGCFFYWLYIPLFAAIIVFIAQAKHKYNRVYCTVYDIPATLIGGLNDDTDKFIGLENLNTMLTNFKGDLSDMTSLSTQLNTIFTTNSPSYTNAAWSSLSNFVSTYEDARIQNGSGVISKPNTVRKISPAVSENVESEFVQVDMTAQKLQLTAEQGRRYQTASYRATLDSSIQVATAKIDTLVTELKVLFDPLTDNSDEAIKFAYIGFWVLLGVGSGIIILAFIVLTILFCICTWQRCENGRTTSKVLLAFIGLLVLFFAVLVFIIMVGSVSGSSFCGIIAEVNRGNYNVFDVISEKVESDLLALFKNCSLVEENGNLGNILMTTSAQKEAYNSMTTFFDGLLAYGIYEKKYKDTAGSSGITAQVEGWKKFQSGVFSDFQQVDAALANLNELIKCDDQIFLLTSASCGDEEKTCKGVLETDTYSAPSCSDNQAQANQNFTDLKNYTIEEQALMTSMVTDLSGTTAQTPNTKFTNAKIVLNNLSSPYTVIYNALSASLAPAVNYEATQSELVDCRVFRRVLLNFEKESCFGFNYYVYIILVIAAVCAVLLLFLSWCLCCALSEEGNFEDASIIEDPYADKHVIKEVGDVLDFEEREIIPNY